MSDQPIDPPQLQSDLRQALAGRLYEANRRAAGRWDSTPWMDVREHYSKTRDEWLAVADEALASQPPAPEAQREPTDDQLDASRFRCMLKDPEGARHLLHLLQQRKGDEAALRSMIDRIIVSRQAAGRPT